MKNKTEVSWNDISIFDYMQIISIIKDDTLTEFEQKVELIKILTHNPDIDLLSVSEFNKVAIVLNLLTSKIPHNKLKRSYVINGRKYNTCNKIDKITTGQFIDYTNLCEHTLQLEDIGKVVAYLLIPENGKYNVGYDMDDLVTAIENEMSITDAYGFVDFFLKAQTTLFHRLRVYLTKEIAKTDASFKTKVEVAKNLFNLEKELNRVWSSMG